MRNILMIAVVLVCGLANAAPTGTWEGKATYTGVDGKEQAIDNFSLVIEQDGDKLTINEAAGWTLIPGALTVSGEDLMYNDKKIGSVSDTKITIDEVEVDNGLMYGFDFAVNDKGTATFADHSADSEGHKDGITAEELTKARYNLAVAPSHAARLTNRK